MSLMKYLLHIIALCLLLAGCGRNSEIDRQLDRADALIESRPDSSLLILDNIDANALSGKEQKARYALLKSMAFDKNYIDTTTFDVLQPAIDYYLEHGTPNEKLRTYYYQGVIFNNQGNRDNALNSFSKAIDLENTITDLYVLARAYAAQGYLYDQLYALEDGLKSNLEASRIYNRISQNYKEFDCLLRAYNEAIILNDKPLADSLSSVCNNFAINDSIEAGKLWQQNLHYASKFGDKEEIRIMLSQQEHSLPFNPDKLMDLALAYNKLGNNEYALELLDIVRASNSEYNGLRLLSVQLPIYKGIGNFKDALSIYEKYSIAYDSINLKKFEYLTQTIQARNKIEIQAQKEAERNTRIIWSCIGGLVILVLLVGVLLLTVRNKQSEKALAIQIARTKEAENAQLKTEQERLALEAENLAHRVDTLEEESRSLKELMATSVELPEEVQKAIQVRIEMLNSLLAGYITSNEQYEKPYDVWVRELTENTEAFMNSNRLAFQASHPRFIQYFEEHGLTEDEINYVCLYAIGLRGKEVGNYMKKPGHVNISSAIRKKLGIDKHETNIGIYVRKLLKSL
ncbi:tetratricopeptide repeat protein [Lepagella muris]|uniref:Uncharacterized protein n=1 Tax=Lepagella muris TaxID=3032870 RepID=A0AC61REN5_9BACT|nr:hypothetical protein [Lepagella muris]TGY78536.1 hypothetical protein E5331_09440 [Lepagella muris]THG51990.1 hypothetical protein E5984_08720 [Bacteroidales bacterium]TKC54885.1 hypothetical protein E5359_016000 [Bacteroidales bacterium]